MQHLLLPNLLILIILINCSPSAEFRELNSPAGENSSLSRLYTDNSGVTLMSWIEEVDTVSKLYYSKLNKNEWSSPVLLSSSSEWFVNWADYPSIISFDGNLIAAHWLKKIPESTYSYNVEVGVYSDDNLISSIVPHTDNTATEHGFVSMIPMSDSTFYAIWLDGRSTLGSHGEHGDLSSSMTLRGALISKNGELLAEHELDNSVCDCCNTSLAKTNQGLIVAYRNRTSEEIRDIYISKFENESWSEPKAVFNDQWEIDACPVNGPSIDVNNTNVAVAWFTSAGESGVVKVAFSADEGDTFTNPVILDSNNPLGRVDVLTLNDGSAWVSWMTRNEIGAQLELTHVAPNGDIIQSTVVTEVNPSRRSGFPQITKVNNSVLVSWTELTEESKKIQTVILE